MTHIPNSNRLIRKFITETILNSDTEIVTELMEKLSYPSRVFFGSIRLVPLSPF